MELTLRYYNYYLHKENPFDESIAIETMQNLENEINIRFKESSVGYKLVNYEIIKIDSETTFNEIIEPTINLTYNKLFKNVNLEY